MQYMLSHPITSVTNSLAAFAGLVTGNMHDFNLSAARAIGWIDQNRINPFEQWVRRQIATLWATLRSDMRRVALAILHYYHLARSYTAQLVTAERKARITGDIKAEAYTRQQVTYALALIQKEAASGYALSLKTRMSLIQRLADVLISRNPLIKDAVKFIVQGLLDLLAIDNPIARIALGFAITSVVNSLGLDRAAGALLRDLIAPILHTGTPANLHDVIEQAGLRLGALEGQQAQFMADGGPEILQAGIQWRDITGLVADAALLAFLADAVIDPRRWARDVADVLGPVTGETVRVVNAALR